MTVCQQIIVCNQVIDVVNREMMRKSFCCHVQIQVKNILLNRNWGLLRLIVSMYWKSILRYWMDDLVILTSVSDIFVIALCKIGGLHF